MKYKVGDKVIVREDLEVGEWYGKEVFVSKMTLLKGKEVTISYIDSYGYYRVKEDSENLRWTDEMFSGKVSQDFIPKEPVSQNTLSEEENSSNIITIKTNKVKLLLL